VVVKGLPGDLADLVAAASRRKHYAPNEVIFRHDDFGNALHFVLSGLVAIHVSTPLGQDLTFTILGEGAIFGELALLKPDGMRTATARALTDTWTLCVLATDFERLCREPRFNAVLVRSLAEQVQRLSSQLQEFLYLPVETRVRRRLVGLCTLFQDGGFPIVVPLSQEQIGNLAGASRQTVNRALRKDEHLRILTLERRRIVVLDPARLRMRAALTS
jgi:CRP-like cAMP-binding protein